MANKSTSMKLTLKITSFIVRMLLNIMFYIVIVIMIINVSKLAFDFTYQLYGPDRANPIGTGKELIFQIKKGETTMDVASKLELSQAIRNKYSFYLKTKLEDKVIMPGTYEISTDMTYDEILAIITDYSASIIKDDEVSETGDDSNSNDNTQTDTDTN